MLVDTLCWDILHDMGRVFLNYYGFLTRSTLLILNVRKQQVFTPARNIRNHRSDRQGTLSHSTADTETAETVARQAPRATKRYEKSTPILTGTGHVNFFDYGCLMCPDAREQR